MHIYTVEEITEADFGCEETGRDKLMAMLKLREDTTSEERYDSEEKGFIRVVTDYFLQQKQKKVIEEKRF